jgi:hypothetical protein
MQHYTCAAVLAAPLALMWGCRTAAKQIASQGPTSEAVASQTASNHTESWDRMRQCAAQADVVAKRSDWAEGRHTKDLTTLSWSNHYSPKYQRCYIEVTYILHRSDRNHIGYELWDAFEGNVVANCSDAFPQLANDCDFVKDRMKN